MKIGSKLKKAREDKRISQQEIAEYLDISQKTYSNIEGDKSKPSLTQLSKLSELLDFDLLKLLEEQGIIFNQKNNKFNDQSSGLTINNLPEKLINQYEARIQEKEEIISLLKEKIDKLEKS